MNLVSETELKKKSGSFISSNICFLQANAIWPRNSEMRAPPQIANCQINSIFHLAKHISEFFSHICEDGWKCSHISHYVLQQMLDFVACKKILNAGYIHPIMASRCQFSSWMEPLDTGPYIRANLETKASCPMDPHFVHPCGRILSHI